MTENGTGTTARGRGKPAALEGHCLCCRLFIFRCWTDPVDIVDGKPRSARLRIQWAPNHEEPPGEQNQRLSKSRLSLSYQRFTCSKSLGSKIYKSNSDMLERSPFKNVHR